jgi:HD-GYP domain-containing protein (c-di-GMP phosphodiesterase class II)
MFRLSDIFSKHKETKDKSEPQVKEEPGTQSRQPMQEGIKISNIILNDEDKDPINSAKAQEIYSEALSKAKQIYRPGLEEALNFNLNINTLIEKIVNSVNTDNKALLKLCLTGYPSIGEYLYGHVVNVCILAVDLGLGLSFEPSRLNELGTAGFLHDIGEIKYLDIINKDGKLTSNEYIKVKEHPQKSVDILSRFNKELSIKIIDAVRQEHERVDGSGYPSGLKDEQINEYAKIIGLADVYEAMTHQRTYRGRYTSWEAIKEILGNKNAFDARIIKILIERIGIFPVGTFVRLNTKEIASVIKDNKKIPLRPVVNIILDASGKKLEEPKQVDLSENSVIYIEEGLKDPVWI